MKRRSLLLCVVLACANLAVLAEKKTQLINAAAVAAPLALTCFSYGNSLGSRFAWGALQSLVNTGASGVVTKCVENEGLEFDGSDEDRAQKTLAAVSFCLPHVVTLGLNTLRDMRNSNFSKSQKLVLGAWNVLCGVGGLLASAELFLPEVN